MKVIFLDIDGVLNHCGTHGGLATAEEPLPIPIAPECMACLNRLIAETGAKVVISSSWRKFAQWQDLGPALVRHGLVGDVIGETPDLINDAPWLESWRTRKGTPFTYERLERGWEIREWLVRSTDVCTCSHGRNYHDHNAAECYYNSTPSEASGCLCSQFNGIPLTGFVILDDCSDMVELKPWLVLTDSSTGLADPDVDRAKWLLEHSADGIVKAREGAFETDNSTERIYDHSCEGYVYFADQGIEVCETCGGCTCCDYADVDHRKARYRCLLSREGEKCLLAGNRNFADHDCARDGL